MALFRKFFYRKPPDGLLEITERVYVLDCCFTTNIMEESEFKCYIGGIVRELHDHLPDSSFMVFNFREGEKQSQIANILSEYDMTVMDYPRHYESCPVLTMEMIHHFLRSSESWLSLGQHNVILMHCERGGWPVLAFMLSSLLIYRKLHSVEPKTLDIVYKQAPRELLQLLSPINPMPSQIRYLQYVSRRTLSSEWPPMDRAVTLDCVIFRTIPDMDGEGGCRPIFRIYGQDPLMVADRTPKVLFSSPKKSKAVQYYNQADCELVKIDIHCHIIGDVVLECITLDDKQEREVMLFRIMFNTAFIRSNLLILNRDEIDILWDAKDQFSKDFRAEVLFSEMINAKSLITIDLPGVAEKEGIPVEAFAKIDLLGVAEKEGLPVEAFAKVHEIFSNVDWSDSKTDVASNVLQKMSASITLPELKPLSSQSSKSDCALVKSTSENITEEERFATMALGNSPTTFLEASFDTNSMDQELQNSLQRPVQLNTTSPVSLDTPDKLSSLVSKSDNIMPILPHPTPSLPSPLCQNREITNNEKDEFSSISQTSSLQPSFLKADTHVMKPYLTPPLPRPPPLPPSPCGYLLKNPVISSNGPPPHAPAPPVKELSKAQNSCPVGNNRNGPPVPAPPPPRSCLSGAKGRGQVRMGSTNQGQTKKTSLKPYHWNKLSIAMKGSLWADTQKLDENSKAPELDMSELESLFSASSANRKSNLLSSVGPKSEKIHLIEKRRAYNCEIMLSKVKIPLSDLMSSVLLLDDSALDVDQVDNLIKFSPTKEEMVQLKGYDKENLGKCEQFFLELMKVPRVESKLRVFSYKMQFSSQVSDLRNSLNVINFVADEIRSSVKLKRIMQTILSLGNALNHGTVRGAAIGFRLDSLPRLTDTRAGNTKMTLMHYLCKVVAEKLPEVLDFPKDLMSLEASTKIQFKFLAEEMQAISKGLEKVIQELNASENDGPVSKIFCKNLKNFLTDAESQVASLASLYSGVGRNADALARYFGEDPAHCPFEQVVSTLLSFVRMFLKAHEENCARLELEKKQAQKEVFDKSAKMVGSPRKSFNNRSILNPSKSGNDK